MRARVGVPSGLVPSGVGARYHAVVRDLVFVVLVVGFFALAVLFVRACELVVGEPAPLEEAARAVSVENAIGLVLAVALLAYLVYALLAPERLG